MRHFGEAWARVAHEESEEGSEEGSEEEVEEEGEEEEGEEEAGGEEEGEEEECDDEQEEGEVEQVAGRATAGAKPLSALAQAILEMLDPSGAEMGDDEAEREAVGSGILNGKLHGLRTSRAGVEMMRMAQPSLPGLPGPEADEPPKRPSRRAAAAAAAPPPSQSALSQPQPSRVGRRRVTDTLSFGVEGGDDEADEADDDTADGAGAAAASPSAATAAPAPLHVAGGARRGASYVKVRRPEAVEAARAQLPIYAEEQRIMEALAEADSLVLCGETGSGKTTQLPQFLYEAGYSHPQASGRDGLIAITQPRRVAAVSMAQRVAYELAVPLGREVAYQVRYDAMTVGAACRIKFMTDGVLLRELQSDLLLTRYSVVIIDEAHERGVNTDLLLGLLSRVVQVRPPLDDR